MKSLHKRLDYQMEEVLKVAALFGQLRAMDKFGIKSTIGFRKWLREVTGNENYGIGPEFPHFNHQTLGEQLVNTFLRKVAQLQDENQNLRSQVEILKGELEVNHRHDEELVEEALEVCRD